MQLFTGFMQVCTPCLARQPVEMLVTVDGVPQADKVITLVDDEVEHHVEIKFQPDEKGDFTTKILLREPLILSAFAF